jgi:hypothetical protein
MAKWRENIAAKFEVSDEFAGNIFSNAKKWKSVKHVANEVLAVMWLYDGNIERRIPVMKQRRGERNSNCRVVANGSASTFGT